MAMKDEYISKINEVLTADDAREMGELVKETVSVFASADPHIKAGLDRYRSRAVVPGQKIIYDNKGDLAKLRGKLVSLREAELKELEADPVRLAFAGVDDDLAECSRLLECGEEAKARSFIDRMVQVYQGDIETIAVGLSGYGYGPENATYQEDLLYIKDQLRHYRAKLAADFAKSAQNSFNIHANAVNQNSVENVLTITQTAEQIQGIPDSVLNEDLKNELKLLLLDMDSAKGKSKKDAEGKLKKVLGWLTDKGVDVALAALPYVLSVLQTLA